VRRAPAALFLALALAATSAGCKKKQLEVVHDEGSVDYGHADLMAAVSELAASPNDPVEFRKLAARIDELTPMFNQRVADEAEVQLAFLAAGPLAAAMPLSPDEQLAALATTVWPTAFRVAPEAGETPRQYLERVCTGAMAPECKHMVPEAWSVALAAKVWRRMKLRAREVYATCFSCQRDPSYQAVLEVYDRFDPEWQARVALLGDAIEPSFWPRAGATAAPWTSAPLLELGKATVSFRGEELADTEWRGAIVDLRGDHDVLGVHLRPRQESRLLHALMPDAARAGYHELALQVREAGYPYPLREYRLAVSKNATLPVRDVDSVQVLVQALEARAARDAERRAPTRP
jgi:hypothetical protein